MDNKSIHYANEAESKIQLSTEKAVSNRFVAFLDIMGFKDRVARTPHSDLLKDLIEFNKEISTLIAEKTVNGSDLTLAQFSDSIVIFSSNASQQSFKELAEVTSGIMYKAIQMMIPLKGAIAYGKVTCDMSKQLFFGQALIDAYLLEENVQFYGVLVHHTAEEYVIKSLPNNIFRDIQAPLKSGKISHYELIWYNTEGNSTETIEALNHLRTTVSDAPRKYIDNTLDVIKLPQKSES